MMISRTPLRVSFCGGGSDLPAYYRNSVDGAFLLPIEIDQDAYDGISEGDEIDIDVSTNEIKNITKNQTYKMKPFSEIIGKIIAAGGLFKYKPDQD